MGAPLRQGGLSRTRALAFVSGSGLVVPFGARSGMRCPSSPSPRCRSCCHWPPGRLIYVTSNEIIPESHSHGHEGTASAGLITGFLLTMVLDAIIH